MVLEYLFTPRIGMDFSSMMTILAVCGNDVPNNEIKYSN